jgi:anthranilate phosphoribosyltransferase
MRNLTSYLQKILSQQTLSQAEAHDAMEIMMTDANAEQISAFLSLLKYRGETADEIMGMLACMQQNCLAVQLPYPVLDIVGTGGDMANTVNISTGSALLAAACGIPVVKHGNKAVSSQCGSADVLETLGVNIELPPTKVADCIHAANIAFLYAPFYHAALKRIRSVRKEMGIPTLFNLVGPLLNPAKAEYLLIGVAKESYLDLVSDLAMQLPQVKKAFIYHGNGLDELSTYGNAVGYLIADGSKTKIEIRPEDYGFVPCDLNELRGGDARTNANLLLQALSGKKSAIVDTLILNTGIAATIYGKSATFEEGFELARVAIKEGKATTCLNKLIEFTNQDASKTHV